jgi:tetratricopeptide (TPR) repeat protein
VLQDDPAFAEAHKYLAQAYAAAGRYDEALTAIDGYGDPTKIVWLFDIRGYVLARMGRRAEAIQTLADMRGRGLEPFVTLLGLGDNDRALAQIEAIVDSQGPPATGLKVDPLFDGLRGEPRFQRLLQRVGFAE